MRFPDPLRDILFDGPEPGQAYRQCLAALSQSQYPTNYGFTETVAYATEVRYAIQILEGQRPERFWNFGDLRGDAEARLFAILDRLQPLRLAFVGSGPYPISAILASQQYPRASITCFDNNVAAYLLGNAVVKKLGLNLVCRFEEAADIDYRPFNAVLLAAMVSDKEAVLRKILEASSAHVIVRGQLSFEHPRVTVMTAPFGNDGSLKP